MQNNTNKTTFDIKKAQEIAKYYAISTNMECLVIDINNKSLINPCEGILHKELCYQKDDKICQCCKDTHILGTLESVKNKKPHVYYCHMGLIHWATPIMANGKLVGGLIGGHAFLEKTKDDLVIMKEILPQYPKLLKEHPEIKEYLLNSPVISNEKLNCLVKLLQGIAKSLDVKDCLDSRIEINSQNLKNFQNMVRGIKITPVEEKVSKDYSNLERALQNNKPSDAKEELIRSIGSTFIDTDINIIKNNLTKLIIIIFKNTMTNQENNQVVFQLGYDAISIMEEISDLYRLQDWASKTLPELLSCCMEYPEIKHIDMIYKATEYIKMNYDKKISLNDMANMVHFSPPYFSKIFKKEMGVTFTQYLKQIRIDESIKLLKNSTIPLIEIPAKVGFEEQSYFSKVFKEITGISPGKYRDLDEENHRVIV